MAQLDPLIRVRKRHVEDKQKILARLYREMETLEDRDAELERRLSDEQLLLEENPTLQSMSGFGVYAARIKEQREELANQMTNLETRINLAQEELREAFAELKKVEIIDRERKAEQKNVQNKKEIAGYDETALMRFSRTEKEKLN